MFKRKRTLYALTTIAVIAIALVVVRSFVLKKVRENLLSKIETLNKSDIKIHYDTIYVDWARNILTIEKLVIEKDAYDTTCVYPEFISSQKVTVNGLGLLSLIFQNELSIDEIHLFKPHWVLHQKSQLLLDSSSRKENEFEIYIKRIKVDSMRMEFTDSLKCSLVTGFRSSATVKDLNLSFHADRPTEYSFSEVATKDTRVDLPRSLYSLTVREARLNLQSHTFELDTLRLIPALGKLQFGRRLGNDIDRIEGVIPFLKLSKLNLHYGDTVIADAGEADIQFFLKVFHDKRLPHKKKVVPLPIEQLRKLPFGLSLEKLTISKSYVEYEEVPANADESGRVFFDNLEGTISPLTNDGNNLDGETILNAKADFMGQGKLAVQGTLPWNTRKKSTVKGSLSGLPFTKLNSMVEPAANMEFESGVLNRIDFAFRYNDDASNGEVSLNYQDLKIVSYRTDEQIDKVEKKKRNRKKTEEELRKDNLKTFIINAFVVRKNLDENVPEEKRTGEIGFERDKTRSVFNYWWKSLFTGIKSAFNLDKAQATVEKLKGKKKK
jgi:hypothetical protein